MYETELGSQGAAYYELTPTISLRKFEVNPFFMYLSGFLLTVFMTKTFSAMDSASQSDFHT